MCVRACACVCERVTARFASSAYGYHLFILANSLIAIVVELQIIKSQEFPIESNGRHLTLSKM